MTHNQWKAGRFDLTWQANKPLLMGIVNITPDSFSDGGKHNSTSAAIAHAQRLLSEGADILDLGGESTRPGADSVAVEEEWARLKPVLQELVSWNVPVSVDTMKAEIMRRALDLGVDILNDVYAFRDKGAVQALAESQAGAVVMHMQGEPRSMQNKPEYDDVCTEVADFLTARLNVLANAGVQANRMLLDPGFGFGKNLQHNLSLMKHTRWFAGQASGVLIGVSRKRMIGELTGQQNPTDRVSGSVAAALYAAGQGAAVLRIHDVQATRDALAVWQALID